MTFVVTDSCIACRYTDCVAACPVDCFHRGPNFLAIHPDECIDCGRCEPVCPVEAIFFDEELPADQAHFLALNRELAEAWPRITEVEGPVEGHEAQKDRKGKLALLQR